MKKNISKRAKSEDINSYNSEESEENEENDETQKDGEDTLIDYSSLEINSK